MSEQKIDWKEIGSRLAGKSGKAYWRSLQELSGSEELHQLAAREFPPGVSEWLDPVGRRQFLHLAAASLALAGLGACTRQPLEKIVPYVEPPEEIVPGKPRFFATAVPLDGFAHGVLVESHMGQPTKIEGNPDHPASQGATNALAQAAILELYDPDRSQVVNNAGRISTWGTFLTELAGALTPLRARGGSGLRVLTRAVTSPTLAGQLERLRQELPQAGWSQYQAACRSSIRAGARLALGEEAEPLYDFRRADVVVSLDADFLGTGPGQVRYARDFSRRRRVEGDGPSMNRLYVIEPSLSLTGAMADHRLAVKGAEVEGLARALARELGIETGAPSLGEGQAKWVSAAARDLERHRGSGIVIAGERQPPAVHALAHAMNAKLGQLGRTVSFIEPPEAGGGTRVDSLGELVEEMRDGQVDLLIILGGNPVYDAPADLGFAESLSRVKLRVHLGLYADETSRLCHWHIPEAHPLESWGDARAYDGTVSIGQPLIEPLYGGKTAYELMATLLGQPGRASYEILRDEWRRRFGPAEFEPLWERALHDGVVEKSAPSPRELSVRWEAIARLEPPAVVSQTGLEIDFLPDPSVGDGRFANNGWLQELPKPLTQLTWDNAALLSPETAARLGVENEDVVELTYRERSVPAPVWILPGQAEDTVTVHLGYGRTSAGRVGNGAGFDAYRLRVSQALWFDSGLSLRKTGEKYPLATTQQHHSMEGRHLIREGSLAEYRENPHFAGELGHDPEPGLSLHPPRPGEGYAWGMAIDLNACTGCGACVVACQSENNIPVVGKTEVRRGREMHWIRVDRYFEGPPGSPRVSHQPVPCMHCENAPCEVVCPVAATVHGPEGLNEMVYNRCVGTRYCANNCPYKVRRFNFLLYADYHTPVLKLLNNPDVTVRTRGVMEKCTYCVQRINGARIEAKREDRTLRDGEVVTACQAVCPSEAIVFGDIKDRESRVARLKADPRHYGILTELNTRPRTTYLARLRNPNPELQGESSVGHGG